MVIRVVVFSAIAALLNTNLKGGPLLHSIRVSRASHIIVGSLDGGVSLCLFYIFPPLLCACVIV